MLRDQLLEGLLDLELARVSKPLPLEEYEDRALRLFRHKLEPLAKQMRKLNRTPNVMPDRYLFIPLDVPKHIIEGFLAGKTSPEMFNYICMALLPKTVRGERIDESSQPVTYDRTVLITYPEVRDRLKQILDDRGKEALSAFLRSAPKQQWPLELIDYNIERLCLSLSKQSTTTYESRFFTYIPTTRTVTDKALRPYLKAILGQIDSLEALTHRKLAKMTKLTTKAGDERNILNNLQWFTYPGSPMAVYLESLTGQYIERHTREGKMPLFYERQGYLGLDVYEVSRRIGRTMAFWATDEVAYQFKRKKHEGEIRLFQKEPYDFAKYIMNPVVNYGLDIDYEDRTIHALFATIKDVFALEIRKMSEGEQPYLIPSDYAIGCYQRAISTGLFHDFRDPGEDVKRKLFIYSLQVVFDILPRSNEAVAEFLASLWASYNKVMVNLIKRDELRASLSKRQAELLKSTLEVQNFTGAKTGPEWLARLEKYQSEMRELELISANLRREDFSTKPIDEQFMDRLQKAKDTIYRQFPMDNIGDVLEEYRYRDQERRIYGEESLSAPKKVLAMFPDIVKWVRQVAAEADKIRIRAISDETASYIEALQDPKPPKDEDPTIINREVQALRALYPDPETYDIEAEEEYLRTNPKARDFDQRQMVLNRMRSVRLMTRYTELTKAGKQDEIPTDVLQAVIDATQAFQIYTEGRRQLKEIEKRLNDIGKRDPEMEAEAKARGKFRTLLRRTLKETQQDQVRLVGRILASGQRQRSAIGAANARFDSVIRQTDRLQEELMEKLAKATDQGDTEAMKLANEGLTTMKELLQAQRKELLEYYYWFHKSRPLIISNDGLQDAIKKILDSKMCDTLAYMNDTASGDLPSQEEVDRAVRSVVKVIEDRVLTELQFLRSDISFESMALLYADEDGKLFMPRWMLYDLMVKKGIYRPEPALGYVLSEMTDAEIVAKLEASLTQTDLANVISLMRHLVQEKAIGIEDQALQQAERAAEGAAERSDEDVMAGVDSQGMIEPRDHHLLLYNTGNCWNQETIEEIRRHIRAGGTVEPIEVYLDEKGPIYIIDGHHRARAHQLEGLPIPYFAVEDDDIGIPFAVSLVDWESEPDITRNVDASIIPRTAPYRTQVETNRDTTS